MGQQTIYLKKLYWFYKQFSNGSITKRELGERWAKTEFNTQNRSMLSDSSFKHIRKKVEEVFDVNIECVGHKYHLEKSSKPDDFDKWIIANMSQNIVLPQFSKLRRYVMYEDIPLGTEYLSLMVKALMDKHRVWIVYNSFYHEPRKFLFNIYGLRVYKQRWYALGESTDHPGEIRCYSFDRIGSVELTDEKYEYPKSFDIHEYYRDYCGLSMGNADVVQDVRIRVMKSGVSFIETLPLHHTQQRVLETPDYNEYTYHLAPNYEFKHELFYREDEIEVLEPQSLREEFAKTFKKLSERYGRLRGIEN